MAKHWYVETSADRGAILTAAHRAFFTRPSFSERAKVWSKTAQLRAMITWRETSAEGADVAAEVVRGGLREAIGSSRNGGGSMLGTTIAVKVTDSGEGTRVAQLWLSSYNTFLGINQQGDLLKYYAKEIAGTLLTTGANAMTHK